MLAYSVTLVFWLSIVLLGVGLARRAALWRQGRAVAVPLTDLFKAPKRYFVDLHHIVAREPFIARAHTLMGGGTVLALLVVALNYGLMLRIWLLDVVLLLAALMALVGALMMTYRRHVATRPSRLSTGAWNRLPLTLLAFAVAITAIAAAAVAGWAVAPLLAMLLVLLLLAGCAELALGVGWAGPMKHAVAGLLHLGFHPRPERFDGSASPTALRLAQDFGVEKPADFAWNRLLSFDACVQCGKCEAVCPAFAAGQPLNPKKLIQDLVVGMAGGTDANYTGSPYPHQALGQHSGCASQNIVPQLIDADTLWSCTTCRACVQACPMMIEHVDAVIDIRRGLTMKTGVVPNKGMEVLQNLRQTDTQGGFDLAARYFWATDLDLPVLAAGESTDYLLVVGEGGFDMRYQRTLRALVKTLHKANLKLAILGAAETDCGDLARRLGDEVEFKRLAQELIGTLKQRQFTTLVTADPHVFHCLKNEYPALGATFTVLHHSQLLSQLLDSGALTPVAGAVAEPVAYHDPCYLGRYNQETAAPRNALKGIGIKVIEMERGGLNSRCCGGGGGAPFTDIAGDTRIPDMRMNDIKATGASRVVVACPQCTAMLEGVVGERPQVLDLAELVAQSVGVQS
ncbi:MAG: DUF3483 domain-containing protein [Formosimonas sp.]